MGDSGKTTIGGKIGIRLANDVNVDDIYDPSGTGKLSAQEYMGALRDTSGSCSTYEEVKGTDGITVSNIQNMEEEIPITNDVHTRRIYIRDMGEGSFSIPTYIKGSATVLDSHQLLWAAENLPNGVTGSVTSGTPGTASEAAEYDPWDDPATSYGFGDGYGGYNIILENTYVSGGNTSYTWLYFDNCEIKPGQSVNPQQSGRATIEFTARRVYREKGGTTTKLA